MTRKLLQCLSKQALVLLHADALPELAENKGNIALLLRAGARGLLPEAWAGRCADASRVFRARQHALRLAGELLDRRDWSSRVELASAMFEWIEGFYNPRRRHTSLGMLSPHEFETRHTAAILEATADTTRYALFGSTRRFSRFPDGHGLGVLAGDHVKIAQNGVRGLAGEGAAAIVPATEEWSQDNDGQGHPATTGISCASAARPRRDRQRCEAASPGTVNRTVAIVVSHRSAIVPPASVMSRNSQVSSSVTKHSGRISRNWLSPDIVTGGSALMRPVNIALRRNASQKSSAVCPNAITLAPKPFTIP